MDMTTTSSSTTNTTTTAADTSWLVEGAKTGLAVKVERALIGLEMIEDALEGYQERARVLPGCAALHTALNDILNVLADDVVRRAMALRANPEFAGLVAAERARHAAARR
jgi:hypothetical protein